MCEGEEFKEHQLVFRMVETPERLKSGQIWEHPQFLPGFEECVFCRLMRDSGYRDLYCYPMVNWDPDQEERVQSQAPDERQRVVMADATMIDEKAVGLQVFDDSD